MKKKLTFTVGITTCYGDDSILDTVKSICASRGVDKSRFIIVADRNPIKPHLKKELKKYGVELIENKIEGSQVKKQKQILKMAKTDILILTQDDVVFEPDTLAAIMNTFEKHPKTTFISVKKQPVRATSLFEDIISVGPSIVNRIVKDWNKGDNYLSSIGRCLAFRTEWIKKMRSPDEIVSSDAFRYFENKKNGGAYEYLPNVAILYKKPQNMKEHLRKSSRFQHQKLEMSRYFGDLSPEYKIPKLILLKSVMLEFLNSPLKLSFFLAVYIYTRLFKSSIQQALNPVWEVELSTKKI